MRGCGTRSVRPSVRRSVWGGGVQPVSRDTALSRKQTNKNMVMLFVALFDLPGRQKLLVCAKGLFYVHVYDVLFEALTYFSVCSLNTVVATAVLP